jgi:hypothetical protein
MPSLKFGFSQHCDILGRRDGNYGSTFYAGGRLWQRYNCTENTKDSKYWLLKVIVVGL